MNKRISCDANGNNNNRIRKVNDNYAPSYTTTYLYDKFNRLTNATATNYSRFYQFDPWGNITNFAGVTLNYATSGNGAPATNRINTDSQSFSYSYDQAGNMTAGMGQSFTYDGANRLKTAGNGNSSFGYDGDGMRVKKSENGADTFYVKSSVLGQTAMEVSSTGVMRAFVYSGGKMVAMQGTDGQFYWLHTNHLGNARTMTDANGNVAYGGQFDPYGQTLAEWSATGNTTLNTKKFTGYERDAATGLDYAQARMYNNARGRFTSPDPIGLKSAKQGLPQSLNRYSYVQNDPVNYVDPSGLLKCVWPFCGAPPDGYYRIIWFLFFGSGGHDSGNAGYEDGTGFPSEGVKWGQSKEGDLELAKATALSRLENDDCAKLFGGKDKATESFNKIKFEYGKLGLPKFNADTQKTSVVGAQTFSSESPPRVVINEQGPFRNVNMLVVTNSGVKTVTLDFGTNLKDAQFASLILLHELGHVNSNESGFKSDGDDSELNRQQTQKVLDACFK